MQNRSRWARTLARRVARQSHPQEERLRWSALASVWAHLGLIGLGVAIFRPSMPIPEADVRYVEVVRTEVAVGLGAARPPSAGLGHEAPAVAPEEPRRPSVGEGTGAAQATPPEPSPRAERFARTEADDAVPTAPERPDAISAHHTAALEATRSPVTSHQPGDPTVPSDGPSDLPGSPTLERSPGDRDAAMGNRPTGDPGPYVVGGGGGGLDRPADVVGPGEGVPTDGRGPSEGGPAGGGRLGGPSGGSTSGAPAPLAVSAPTGPDPTRAVSAPAPAWWQPLAMRIEPPSAPPSDAEVVAAVARLGTGRATVERTGRRTNTGGTQLILPSVPALPDPASTDVGVRRRIAAPGTADPIVELREALGFGPLDREKLAPRPEWAGRLYEEGARDSSPQLALDLPFAWKTAASTRGTALGVYVQRAEEVIVARWLAADLDAHSRAVGLQGDVTVRYQVRPDGRVSDVAIVRSSGNPTLDDMALDAIPARLDRFPRELGKVPFHHEVTLRYRNPLVSR